MITQSNGEFRDVDAPSGDLRQGHTTTLQEPSQTLFLLLGFCVDAGKRFAVADAKIADSNQSNPVGITMLRLNKAQRL